MMRQEAPRFWRIRCQQNPVLIESYCLFCFKFIAASKLELNLKLAEFAHRLVCKQSGSDKMADTGG
jgi:hypothetical protein